jgi:hypothetical protein
MRKLLLVSLFSATWFFSLSAEAATRVQFFPGNKNVMVNITEVGADGVGDNDVSILYEALILPEQTNAFLGVGKGFRTPKNEFSISCSKDKKQCSIVLTRSPYLVIRPQKQFFELKVTGELAFQISTIWPESFEFRSEDRLLFIHSSTGEFLLRSPGY